MQPVSAQTNPEPGTATQGQARCSRCGRENAADAKFCAGCGIVLTNAAEATGEALDASLSAEFFKPLPRRDPQFAFRVTVVGGVLAVVVAGGAYFLYKNFLFTDFSPAYMRSAPAGEERKGGLAGQVGTGVVTPTIRPEAPAPVPERDAAAISPESVETPPPGPQRPVPAEPRAPRKAAPARVAIKPAAVRAESCTEALAAVGLCQSAAPQGVRAPADAPPKPAAQRPAAASCQEGVAALGLCEPASNQRKE